MHTITKMGILIWETDNNGQIARSKTGRNATSADEVVNGIGNWHLGETCAKGNGEKMAKMIQNSELAATNAIHPPKWGQAKNSNME